MLGYAISAVAGAVVGGAMSSRGKTEVNIDTSGIERKISKQTEALTEAYRKIHESNLERNKKLGKINSSIGHVATALDKGNEIALRPYQKIYKELPKLICSESQCDDCHYCKNSMITDNVRCSKRKGEIVGQGKKCELLVFDVCLFLKNTKIPIDYLEDNLPSLEKGFIMHVEFPPFIESLCWRVISRKLTGDLLNMVEKSPDWKAWTKRICRNFIDNSAL